MRAAQSKLEKGIILLTGAQGQLGLTLLLRSLQTEVSHDIYPLSREQFDLAHPETLPLILERLALRFEHYREIILLNAAAYTQVDLAETHPKEAEVINTIAVDTMARACARLQIRFIQISTDYVFDGAYDHPYPVDYPPHPISVYGTTKWHAEEAVARAMPLGEYAIVRTSWLYSPYRQNFYRTMWCLAHERSELRVVADQIGAPSSTESVAEQLFLLCSRREALPPVLHFVNRGETSWYGFAQAIVEKAGRSHFCKVVPITTEEYPTAAHRPRNSRLEVSYLDPNTPLCSWQEALRLCPPPSDPPSIPSLKEKK